MVMEIHPPIIPQHSSASKEGMRKEEDTDEPEIELLLLLYSKQLKVGHGGLALTSRCMASIGVEILRKIFWRWEKKKKKNPWWKKF